MSARPTSARVRGATSEQREHGLWRRTSSRASRRLTRSVGFWVALLATAVGAAVLMLSDGRSSGRRFAPELTVRTAPIETNSVPAAHDPAPEPGSTAASERPTLGPGSISDAVAELQERLRALGFDPGVVDGRFGAATAAAVVALQADRGLDPDGVVGPATWAELDGASP